MLHEDELHRKDTLYLESILGLLSGFGGNFSLSHVVYSGIV